MSTYESMRRDVWIDRVAGRKMDLRTRAWSLLTDLARIRGERIVSAWAYRKCEQLTGKPWALCGEIEYQKIIKAIGGEDE
jgi:hypothetical protein